MDETPKWLEKAKETFKFHRSKLLSNSKWTITLTAKALRRSYGSVNEDIMIARWCRTHENQLSQFTRACDALDFIRKKKNEMETAGLE